MKGSFTQGFSPVARHGQSVLLDDGEQTQTYTVEQVTHPVFIETQSVTVADGDSEKVELNNLETWEDWLAQYRFLQLANDLPDGVDLKVDLGGQQAPLWTTKNVRGEADNHTGAVVSKNPDSGNIAVEDQYDHLTELYVFEDDVPFAEFVNSSGGEVTVSLNATGYQYNLSTEPNPVDEPAYIPTQSIRGR